MIWVIARIDASCEFMLADANEQHDAHFTTFSELENALGMPITNPERLLQWLHARREASRVWSSRNLGKLKLVTSDQTLTRAIMNVHAAIDLAKYKVHTQNQLRQRVLLTGLSSTSYRRARTVFERCFDLDADLYEARFKSYMDELVQRRYVDREQRSNSDKHTYRRLTVTERETAQSREAERVSQDRARREQQAAMAVLCAQINAHCGTSMKLVNLDALLSHSDLNALAAKLGLLRFVDREVAVDEDFAEKMKRIREAKALRKR